MKLNYYIILLITLLCNYNLSWAIQVFPIPEQSFPQDKRTFDLQFKLNDRFGVPAVFRKYATKWPAVQTWTPVN